ncbi:hypothetical protein CPB97_006999 [Podila verticillata]|nr:hypothetical protein CPB97_006999 [Podila verticillata]
MRIKTAVVLLGNSGAGKSTLLTQLGAMTFKSGVRLRSGYTEEVQEEMVVLNGQNVILMDVPGLYESREQATQRNAKVLTKALSKKGYDYKLYFVTKADNRGPSNADLVMMSKINKCIKQVSGSRVSFRVIVNQIMGEDMYEMYQQEMAFDNFVTLFKALDTDEIELRGFSFDIEIDKVMLLRFSESDVSNNRFKDVLAADVCECSQYEIGMEELKAIRVRRGYTEDVYEEEAMLNCKPVLLIDVPGLFEPRSNQTESNARKLTEALSRGYDYKLYFIMQATNRGPSDKEMVMMSKVNECIKQANGSQVSFRVIVNQIMSKEVHNMYQQYLGHDNCKSLLQILGAEIPKFSFDIKIDGVMLLPFNTETVDERGFANVIAEDVRQHKHYTIRIEMVLQVSYDILKMFQDALEAAEPYVSKAATVAQVVVGAVWLLYRALRGFEQVD